MPEEKRRWKITNFFRKSTPVPADREVFQMGIQERHHPLAMTGPIVYHVADSSVILRTCITQLKMKYLEGVMNGVLSSLLNVWNVEKNMSKL